MKNGYINPMKQDSKQLVEINKNNFVCYVEAFRHFFDLPSESFFCETCFSIESKNTIASHRSSGCIVLPKKSVYHDDLAQHRKIILDLAKCNNKFELVDMFMRSFNNSLY